MLHRSRYTTSVLLPSPMRPPMCLQYIVMALAAASTETFRHLATPFYQRARAYAESDEMMVSFVDRMKFPTKDICRIKGSNLQLWPMHNAGP